MSFADITHPDDVDAESEALRQLVAGERRRYLTEKRCLRADGRLVWVSLSLSPVRDEVGNTLYLISQMQDVTRAQANRGEARSSGHARPAHGAAQPHLVHRPDAARQGASGAWRLAGAPVLRPRRLQGGQRQLRARGGRPNPDAGRGPAALDPATQRHRVQVRRRRVRAALRGGRDRGGGADRIADRRGLLGAVRDRRQRGLLERQHRDRVHRRSRGRARPADERRGPGHVRGEAERRGPPRRVRAGDRLRSHSRS